MKKTNGLVRVFLGLSMFFLIGECVKYIEGNFVIEPKLYLRLGLAVTIITVLYMKEFRLKNNFLTALKDSFPYFLSLYLIISLGTWVPMLFGGLLMLWDFGGDG